MAKLSKDSPQVQDYGVVAVRETAGDGYTINFVTFRENVDHRPLLKGLPDDRCQCAHWGYVLKGRMRFEFGDREEVYEAGDAFYAPPGHIPVENEPGTEYLQFSPSDDLQKTSEAIMANMQQLQQQERTVTAPDAAPG
jgi:mannose-6-phosphate isomerase-like protein (cupin superfamily)